MALVSVEAMLGKVGAMMPGKAYTSQDIAYIRSHYGMMPMQKLARRMKRTVTALRRIAQINGIRIERSPMTWERFYELFGITDDAIKWRIRNANPDEDVIPHERCGRYYIFYESDVIEWLRRGHILTFDRSVLHPDLQRMYDAQRRRYYTNNELISIDLTLRIRSTDEIKPKIISHYIGHLYDRADVWAIWWSRGYLMPVCNDPYVMAIRTAWHATFVSKSELRKYFSRDTVRNYAKRCHGSTAKGIRKVALREYFERRGMHDMAKRFAEKPIFYMELINEVEGRHSHDSE